MDLSVNYHEHSVIVLQVKNSCMFMAVCFLNLKSQN
jgi:hypothetical protein